MIKRILAIDIGNTAGTIGFYEGGRLLDFGSIFYDDIPNYAINLVKSGKYKYLYIVISSVFPKITDLLKSKFKGVDGLKVWVCGANLPLKIKHNYSDYNALGCDRKVNIYGATRMYKLPLLIIDYGTAITFDYVDAKGVFRGGMIIPGPETALRALSQRAALLPKNLRLPRNTKSFLGRNTRECMESGILEGYGAMTDELINRFRKRYGNKLRVLATGGFAKTLRPYAKKIQIVDPQHSVKSLLALWREHHGVSP